MKITLIFFTSLLCLLFVASVEAQNLTSQAQKAPFSSMEEKRFILQLAGRDGRLEKREWESSIRNRNDKGYFKGISWKQLSASDIDGDGMVGVNEFYRYIDKRFKATQSKKQKGSNDLRLRNANANLSAPLNPDSARSKIDRRKLFQRAQIAKRTKFQNRIQPEQDAAYSKSRQDHLNTIRKRRIAATADIHVTSRDELSRLKNIYKSRIVKNRRYAATGVGAASTRKSNDRNRMGASQQEDQSHRRALIKNRKSSNRSSTPSGKRNKAKVRKSNNRNTSAPIHSRDASDIRSLIPRSKDKRSNTKKPVTPSNRSAVKKAAPSKKRSL